jgi:hypothetical protein
VPSIDTDPIFTTGRENAPMLCKMIDSGSPPGSVFWLPTPVFKPLVKV